MKRSAAVLALSCAVAAVACNGDKVATGTAPSSPTAVPSVAPFATVDPNAPVPIPAGDVAPVLILRFKPYVPEGPAPFELVVDMCDSYDSNGDRIHYTYDFGNGTRFTTDFCHDKLKYKQRGEFHANFCVQDEHREHKVCGDRVVRVQ
jgi:ABC-type oligopeptide transport system substrate-binding subunit